MAEEIASFTELSEPTENFQTLPSCMYTARHSTFGGIDLAVAREDSAETCAGVGCVAYLHDTVGAGGSADVDTVGLKGRRAESFGETCPIVVCLVTMFCGPGDRRISSLVVPDATQVAPS